MALVFAVFILALLVVFLRPEGRASRIARLKAVAAGATEVTKTVLNRGTETVDRIAADLAEDHRGTGGVSQLLTPAEGAGTDPLEQSVKT
jgi:hypothetical protein